MNTASSLEGSVFLLIRQPLPSATLVLSALADTDTPEEAMFPISPYTAHHIAAHQIDERIRNAEAGRLARSISHPAPAAACRRTHRSPGGWRFHWRRAFA